MSDVPAGARWFGYPAKPGRELLRNIATLRRWVSEDGAARGGDKGADDGVSLRRR